MAWFVEILKSQLEENLTKYCIIKYLILLKLQNMMDTNVDLLQNRLFDKKNFLVAVLKMRIFQAKN